MIDDKEGIIVEIMCPECGSMHKYYITKENTDYDFLPRCNQGQWMCAWCGRSLVYEGSYMRSDMIIGLSDEDDSVIHCMECDGCGCSVEIFEPTQNEIATGKYPFWNESE